MAMFVGRARVQSRLLGKRATGHRWHAARRRVAATTALAVAGGLVPFTGLVSAPAVAAPVGAGFNLNAGDLRFILKQIKISEHHAANFNPDNPCAGLVGPGPDQIPSGGNTNELPWGLRTVDGSCNNLTPGQEGYGAADELFPRRVSAHFKDAEAATFDVDGPGPAQVGDPSSYKQYAGNVFDSQPRVISNLIVDQTATNPAAVAAAGPNAPVDQKTGTLFIPNTAPDVGLSAPYNSVFTLFGQFFDHGLDLVSKGGGTVFMPLKGDDPLVLGPDGQANTADDLPPQLRFMAMSRSTNQPGPDGKLGTADDIREATNLTTPFVDQNQTYSSHPSQQVFLREYAMVGGKPKTTGRLVTGAEGGMATWGRIKQQAQQMLGIALTDYDVLNLPLLAADPYGNFIPDPVTGFPQVVKANGVLVSGTPASPVSTGNALRTGHAFLDDIAHHAVPVGDPTGHGGPASNLTPDSDPGTGDDHLPGTYDDEMLRAHYIAGDGRVNENIGLTSIHHVFHSEHNRLAGPETTAGSIKQVLVTEDPGMVAQWKRADGTWNGDRIFQAAKFVTEMEYQHLVFEEFARKMQPMVNAFGEGGTGYDTSVNSAIKAEFAHAVYRFGHSMLTETVARRNADGSRNDIALLNAFLNPPSFTDGGGAGTLTADEGAGSVFRGMSRQVGSEIDEFVTGALRSNLLGLPLDLAAINIARSRESGVPTLNKARTTFYQESNNSALMPYESWADLAFNLRHPESLVNFVAAYGTHPSLAGPDETVGTADDTATTVRAKRAAAQLLIDGDPLDPTDPAPADAADFLNGTGAWAARQTGLDDVDLWVGGLAEKPMAFGGMLGSTFNYVFELQMEDLQFGDRFYYLSRTAGLNLLTQLEGNSFAELVMRNTDVEGLPADAFSRPDLIFNVGNLGTSGAVPDDTTTEEYDESTLLSRMPNGTLRFAGPEHVVFNGTAGDNRMWSSEGDDTVRGNDGNDWMQGGDGSDNLIGGLGDDIMTDIFGDDTLKGGDGDDALSSGQGFGGDLNQGGRGRDFVVNGNDDSETFGGPGGDFVLGGDGQDTIFGDEGNDWIEGGKGPFNLLQGDNGNPFQDDPNGGHDVIDGDGGAQDFDAEGGDDIMLLGPGVQRAEGMLGFDWAIHKGDPSGADSDMSFTGLLPPTVATLRDRFDLVEGLSGWKFDDVLRGNGVTVVPAATGGAGGAAGGEVEAPEVEAPAAEVGVDPADHQLTTAGIARIDGLAALLPPGSAPFSAGNIILGGGGNDLIEGRGGDDVIDGDRWVDVQLSAPNPATPDPGDRQLVDNLRPLQNDVFAGRIDPGDITIVRSVKTAPAGTSDDDRAVFSDLRVNYDCLVNDVAVTLCPLRPNGSKVTVVHAAGTQADGTDTVTNVENLVFADSVKPGAPTGVTATAGNKSATLQWTRPTAGAVSGYRIKVIDTTDNSAVEIDTAATAPTHTVTQLTNGRAYRFQVLAYNNAGESAYSAQSNTVTPTAVGPTQPLAPAVKAGDQQVRVSWSAPADDGGSAVTGYEVRVVDVRNQQVGALRTAGASATGLTVTGLTNGRQYWFTVFARNEAGLSPASREVSTSPAPPPGAPAIGTALARDGAAVAQWQAPLRIGALPVTAYRVRVVDARGSQVGRMRTANAAATRLRVGGLRNGSTYHLQVAAVSEIGRGAFSQPSNAVVPGTRPGAPRIARPQPGAAGGALTARARWLPPSTETLPQVTDYRVIALRVSSRAVGAKVERRFRSPLLPPGRRGYRFVLPRGLYRFQVVALNDLGRSPLSRASRAIRAR